MKEALDLELQKAFARCRFLQILRIDMPKSYEDSIVSTQVEVQKTNMRKFEQQAELIRQNISVIISEADQIIKVTNATGQAEAFRIKQFAQVIINLLVQANALNNTIQAESDVYSLVENSVGLNPAELTQYIYYNGLMDQKNAKVLVGLQNAILNLNNNPGSQ